MKYKDRLKIQEEKVEEARELYSKYPNSVAEINLRKQEEIYEGVKQEGATKTLLTSVGCNSKEMQENMALVATRLARKVF